MYNNEQAHAQFERDRERAKTDIEDEEEYCDQCMATPCQQED